jgi:UDP-N-acetylglucosamine acyltransferase
MKVHPTSIIHPEAKVHPSCEIGPFCTIAANVVIGAENRLMSHVVIESNVTIGERNVFYPFSVIGGLPQDLKYRGEKTVLTIGNNNVIRESVTLNVGTEGGGGITSVGDHNLLMAYVHLGHDTRLGSHTVIANSCQIAGHVTIEDWAIIGGISGVSQFVRVGAHSYVGGCSAVDRDVAPFSMGRGSTGNYEVLGMNLVGLKRRKFSDEDISALQEVNKLFFKDRSLEKEASLQRLEEKLGSNKTVQQFIRFVRSSEKGTYR